MNLVMQFISNVITTVFTLSLLFISIIVATLMVIFLLPIGCIGSILKTKSIKSVPRYIKKVVAVVSDATDEFFYHIANSLKHTWRV